MKKAKSELDTMVRVGHTAPIDITPWAFFDDVNHWRDLLAAGFAVHINQVLRDAFEERPPNLWFAAMYGNRDGGDGVSGKCPDDAATLYLGLPLGPNQDDIPHWSISLEDVVSDMIEYLGPEANSCSKVAARLRELADKLDNAKPPDPA